MQFWLLAALALYLVSAYVVPTLGNRRFGVPAMAGPRDALPADSPLVSRARRAHANLQENMPIFLTLGLLALVSPGVEMGLALTGAKLFVGARLVYTPAYLSGVPYLRSAVYTVGLIGCFVMAFALI